MFSKYRTTAQYEKRTKEMERLLGRKEIKITLLRSFMNGSS